MDHFSGGRHRPTAATVKSLHWRGDTWESHMDTCHVVVEGHCLNGFDPARVRTHLAKLIRQTEEIARRLLSGHEVVVKSRVDVSTGARYVEALRAIGVASRLVPETQTGTLQLDDELAAKLGSVPVQAVETPAAPSVAAIAAQTEVPMEAFYKAAIGPRNQPFYLNYFSKAERNNGFLPSWHWPACFVTLGWFLYRKLFLEAILYLVAVFVLGGFASYELTVNRLSGSVTARWAWLLILVALWILSFALPAVLANGMYYRHVRSRVSATKAAHRETSHQLREATLSGGTSWLAVAVGLALYWGVVTGVRIVFNAYVEDVKHPAAAAQMQPPPTIVGDAPTPAIATEVTPTAPAPVPPPTQAQSSDIEDRFLRDPVIFDRTNYAFESPRVRHVTLSISSPSISYPEILAAAFKKYPYLNDNGPFNESLMEWYAVIVTARTPNGGGDGLALLYAVELVVDAKEHGNVVCRADGLDIYPEPRRNEAYRLLRKGPNMVGWGRRCEPA